MLTDVINGTLTLFMRRDELDAALQRPVVRNLCALIRLRNTHPAFGGDFSSDALGGSELVMRWRSGVHLAELRVDFADRDYQLVMTETGVSRSLELTALALDHTTMSEPQRAQERRGGGMMRNKGETL